MLRLVGLCFLFGLLFVHGGAAQGEYDNCSFPKVCVPLENCRNGTSTSSGQEFINFELLNRGNHGCRSLEVCCSLDDVLQINEAIPVKPVIRQYCYGCGCSNPEGVMHVPGKNDELTAQVGEFPWVVVILNAESGELIATGSLLTPSVVLTKAHNISNLTPDKLIVRAGEWDMSSTLESYAHSNKEVYKIENHKRFDIGTTAFNVALLILKNPFEMTPHISTICLADQDSNSNLKYCIVSGWGKKSFGDAKHMNIQKKVTLSLIKKKRCQKELSDTRSFDAHFQIPESVMCAGDSKNGDSCTGDGGGPLFCPLTVGSDRYVQLGIVNWGPECGHSHLPSLYTNVSFVRPWIDQTLAKYNVYPSDYTAP